MKSYPSNQSLYVLNASGSFRGEGIGIIASSLQIPETVRDMLETFDKDMFQ